MKKNAVIAILFISLAGFSVHYRIEENKIQSFNWLIGTWKMDTKRGVIHEKWNADNDSTLSGESTITRSTGETVLREKLEFAYRGKDYYYIPTVQGQNNDQPVPFRITSHSEKGFVAENPEHDFPKRIVYDLVTSDSIHAFIDGGPELAGKRADFYYSKIKN
jgi:hypothetical protein